MATDMLVYYQGNLDGIMNRCVNHLVDHVGLEQAERQTLSMFFAINK
jgi:hypothetical protein